jgi:hypothetical protein
MGGFWPKMNANGRLDTCELNVLIGILPNSRHSERVRKVYNCASETGIKSQIKVIFNNAH